MIEWTSWGELHVHCTNVIVFGDTYQRIRQLFHVIRVIWPFPIAGWIFAAYIQFYFRFNLFTIRNDQWHEMLCTCSRLSLSAQWNVYAGATKTNTQWECTYYIILLTSLHPLVMILCVFQHNCTLTLYRSLIYMGPIQVKALNSRFFLIKWEMIRYHIVYCTVELIKIYVIENDLTWRCTQSIFWIIFHYYYIVLIKITKTLEFQVRPSKV